MSASVTKHAEKRIRERRGSKASRSPELAERARTEGICYNDTTGKLHRYLTWLWHKGECSKDIYILGNQVYIFASETLITVLPLPGRFERTVASIRKRKELQKTETPCADCPEAGWIDMHGKTEWGCDMDICIQDTEGERRDHDS